MEGVTVLKTGSSGGTASDPGLIIFLVTWTGDAAWRYYVPTLKAKKAESAFRKHKSTKKFAAALKKGAEREEKLTS